MLSEGALPRAEVFSWTRAGAPWIDFEWLSQAAYAAAFSAAGWPGLWLLKLAVLGTALLILVETLREQGQTPAGQAIGLIFASLALIPSADVRPENFSLLFFIFQLGWLEHERRAGARGAARFIAAFAMYALWANLHAGFVFGLALIACYALGAEDLTKFYSFAGLGLAAAAGTLVNPYGAGVWLVLAEHARGIPQLSELLVEWKPVSLKNAWTWPFWALLWSVPAGIWKSGRDGRSLPRAHLFAMAGLAAACFQTRNTPYFSLAAAVYVPRLLGKLRAEYVPPALAASMFFLAFWVWPGTPIPPWRLSGWPDRAAAFLEEERGALGSKSLYHPYGWGGYLGWRLPGEKVFWDGRYLFQDLLVEENQARESPKTWQAFLDKHHVDVAVLEHTKLAFSKSGENDIPRPFYVYFMPQARWALVHWDPDALVFVRRDKAPSEWLADREFRYMRPGDEAWVRHQIDKGVLSREALRHDTERIFEASDLTPRRPK
jgi:hypothetical protein